MVDGIDIISICIYMLYELRDLAVAVLLTHRALGEPVVKAVCP
jgi:hypothetical protein